MTSVLNSLNSALHTALASDPCVVLLGEDILDPYGGAFKVTRGLSQAFPGRVMTTPISEAGITGIATGMALRGLRPVVEIMFGDFVTLIADQLINHAVKFGWMYSGGKSPDEQVHVPMVIRTPMGGRRGYGPTHSQTLEKHFLGVPGLRVLAPSMLGNPGDLLLRAILDNNNPLLFIENKLLYLAQVIDGSDQGEFELHEENGSFRLTLRAAPPPTLTLATYGYMTELCRQAMLRLAYENEIFIELISLTQLAPFTVGPIMSSLKNTGRLLTVEEGGLSLGWGAEILARAAETPGSRLQVCRRLAARDLPVPASTVLESEVLPGVQQIVQNVQMMV